MSDESVSSSILYESASSLSGSSDSLRHISDNGTIYLSDDETSRKTEVGYGGYDFEFVKGLEDDLEDMFMCKICHLPSRNAQLSVCCGHTFCKSCLDELKRSRTRSSKLCPVCRSKNIAPVPNKQVDRKIRSLRVYCINKEKGCEWQGEVNDINVHLSDACVYESIECTNGCGEMLQRRCLTQHTATECSHRKINCPHCNLSGIHHFVTGDHMRECPKVIIACPNHCQTENILREDMDEHRKVCSLEVVSCKYAKLGCGTRMARKEVEKHGKEKMEEHLCMATGRLEKLENAMARLENVISQLEWSSHVTSQMITENVKVAPIIMKITRFSNKRDERACWESPYFHTEDEGYIMYLKVTFCSSYLKVYMSLGDNADDDLAWPFRGRFDLMILNQISNNKHYSRRIAFDDRCSDDVAGRDASKSWGISRFISYNRLCAVSSTRQYVKDDNVFIKVSYCEPDYDTE